MRLNFRPRRFVKKVLSERLVLVMILGLFPYLVFDMKRLNSELVKQVDLSHSDLRLNSTQRQICYHKLELKERSLAVKVRFISG